MRVRLIGNARQYVQQEKSYLAARSKQAAEDFLARMREAQVILGQFPDIGLAHDLPIPGTRRLIIGSYLLDYRMRPDEVQILLVRHARQLPLTSDDDTVDP